MNTKSERVINVFVEFRAQNTTQKISRVKKVLSDLSQTGFCTYVRKPRRRRKKQKLPTIHESFM